MQNFRVVRLIFLVPIKDKPLKKYLVSIITWFLFYLFISGNGLCCQFGPNKVRGSGPVNSCFIIVGTKDISWFSVLETIKTPVRFILKYIQSRVYRVIWLLCIELLIKIIKCTYVCRKIESTLGRVVSKFANELKSSSVSHTKNYVPLMTTSAISARLWGFSAKNVGRLLQSAIIFHISR